MKSIQVKLIISIVLFISCGTQDMNKEEFLSYLKNEDTGLVRTEYIDEQEYIFIYKPLELIAIEQCNVENDTCNLERIIKENENFEYFNMIIKDKGENGRLQQIFKNKDLYMKKLEYMVSEMKNDFVLIDGYDTLSCVLYNFEPPFKPASELRFAVGFEKKSKGNNRKIQVIFNDRVFENGFVKCNYSESVLKNIPNLKLN